MESTHPTFLTVRQFSERHPAFSEGSLRWLIFNSGDPRRNVDLSPAIIKVGRRVYLDEAAFFTCLKQGSLAQPR